MTISVPVRSRYENKYIHIHAALYNGDDFLWTTYDTASGNQPYLVNEASSRCYELIDEYKPPYEDYLAYEFNNNFRFSDISFTSEIVGNYKGKGLSYSADIRIPYDYISKTYNKDGSSESSDSGSSSLRFNVIFGSLPPSLSYKCLTFSDNPSAIYNAVLLASNIDLPYEKRV